MSMGETAGVVGFAAFGDDPATNEPLHPQAAVRAALEGYLDEEDLLDFHVWIAELELLVGTARTGRADPVACFELLQKLLVSIDRTDRARLKEYGRRCEAALVDILLRGTCPPVRRLICASLSRLYAAGDTLPMYARVAALQGFLASKEALGKGTAVSEAARVGALQCLANLCATHGHALASGMLESLNVAVKHTSKTSEPSTRCAALGLIAALIEGLGSFDRNAEAVQTLSLKTVLRTMKETADAATWAAATSVLQAIACTEGIALWVNVGSGYEELVRLCVNGLNYPLLSVSHGFAAVLGAIAAAAKTSKALASAQAAEKKASRKAALDKLAADAFSTCLVDPFVEAAAAGDRPRACTALAQCWLTYMRLLQAQETAEESQLLDLAVKAIEMLSRCSPAAQSHAGAEAELGAGLASGEVPQPQACVLYILRVGVIEQLGELSQRRLLEKLAELARARGQISVAIVALECMRVVTGVLGEVPVEGLPLLQEPVTAQLSSPHACLRSQAASALAALAVAEQASAAAMLESCLDNLATAAVQLTALLGGGSTAAQHRLATSAAATPAHGPAPLTPAETERVKPLMDALHGNALGAAALLVASARMPLGVPSRLVQQGVELAQSLITRPSCKRAVGQGCEREAGYMLLGALCTCLPPATLQDKKLEMLELWRVALSTDAAKQLDLRQYVTSSMAEGEAVLAMELAWRAAALEALQAYMASILPHASRSQGTRVQRMLSSLLQPTLDAVCTSPALQDPVRGGKAATTPQFAAATAMLQLRLLEAYLSMPNAATFQTQHEALIRLCARSLRPGAIASAATAAGGASGGLAASSTLQGLLNKQDSALGPWSAARNPLEDALQAFAGAPGGPLQQAWQTGLHLSGDADDGIHQLPSSITGGAASPPFPQPRALGTALQEAQVTLLGSLLAVVSQQNQLQILDLLATAAAAPTSKSRDRDAPGVRRGIVTAVCCAALAGLVVLARPQRGELDSREGVADKVRALAEVVLAESTGTAAEGPDAALQRCAAEMFAFAACIGSDGYAAQLARAVCQAAADSTSPSRRATLALAAGCMYRSKGGMALLAAVPVTVQTLLALGRSQPPGPYHLWYLHGLWLVANAAGLAFVPFVKATLALALDALMWEEAEVGAGVRAAVGRLANALVAVLGPELSPGSAAYINTKALIRGMKSTEVQDRVSEPASGNAMAAELERVLYAQMLVLFAPQAVPAAAHLPLLVHTLQAAQPALRQAAAATLRHLAERDPGAMPGSQMEAVLFAALDTEADAGIAAQLRATLRTLLHAGAPRQPAHWLSICASVALASGPAGSTAAAAAAAASGGAAAKAGAGDLGQGLMEGADSDDSDEDEASTARPAASTAPAQPEAPDIAFALAPVKAPATPRLRTRLFAARCVLELPSAVGSDPRHFDAIAAQQEGQAQAGAWLVLQLQQLVDAGFKMATGQVEALRPLGLHLLKTVMARFAKAEDPLMEGHSLLELYQAQYVSALRSALAREAPAALSAAGAALAVAFMRTGMALEDGAMLRHLMRLLCRPLADWGMPQPEVHAEWVGMRAHVALLEAHAHCTVLASAQAAGTANVDCSQAVHHAQAPFLWLLRNHWSALVADHMVMSTQPLAVQLAFIPRLFPTAPQPSIAAIAKFLDTAWPHVLAAVSASVAAQVQRLPAHPSSSSEPALDSSGQLSPSYSNEQGHSMQQLSGDMLALMLDACHLAISRATTSMQGAPDRQVSWKPSQPSRATVSLAGGQDDDLTLSSASGLTQLSTALACLQRLLSCTPVLEAVGIEGCSGAVRLLLQVLQQVIGPQAVMRDPDMLQPLMPCLHALTSALEGLLAALPQAYLADTFLQELLVQSLLSMLSAASSLSSQSQQGATQPEAGEGLAGMLFAAADKLTQQLTDADLDGRTPPTWVVLPLWQCAIELLESCQDDAMLDATCRYLAASLAQAAAALHADGQPAPDQGRAAERHAHLAGAVTSIAQAAAQALAACRDGEVRPGLQPGASLGSEARASRLVPLMLQAGGCLPLPCPAAVPAAPAVSPSGQERSTGHAAALRGPAGVSLDGGSEHSARATVSDADPDGEAFESAEGDQPPDVGSPSALQYAAGAESPAADEQPEAASVPVSSDSQPAATSESALTETNATVSQQSPAAAIAEQPSAGDWSDAGSNFGSDWEAGPAQQPEASSPGGALAEAAEEQEVIISARNSCLQVLEDAASAGSPTAVRFNTLQAARLACQSAVTADDAQAGDALQWTMACTAHIIPAAAALARAQLSSDSCSSLPSEDVQAITELLKLLLVALSASGRYSTMSAHQDNEASIMRLLVTLAVTALAPTHGVPHRDVAALVQQLVLRLVAGPSAPAFREALSTLAPASVQALQVALRASAASVQSGVPTAGSSKLRQPLAPPSIALKNFAIPKPPA